MRPTKRQSWCVTACNRLGCCLHQTGVLHLQRQSLVVTGQIPGRIVQAVYISCWVFSSLDQQHKPLCCGYPQSQFFPEQGLCGGGQRSSEISWLEAEVAKTFSLNEHKSELNVNFQGCKAQGAKWQGDVIESFTFASLCDFHPILENLMEASVTEQRPLCQRLSLPMFTHHSRTRVLILAFDLF